MSSASGQALTRLDAGTGEEVGEPFNLGGTGGQITFTDDGDAWVAVTEDGAAGSVLRFGPDGGQPEKIPVGAEPSGIAAGANFVWVANSGSDNTSRLNLVENVADRTIEGMAAPAGVVAGNADKEGIQPAKGIWITNSAERQRDPDHRGGRHRFDPARRRGEPDRGGIGGDDLVWVAAQDDNALTQIRPRPEPVPGGAAGERGADGRVRRGGLRRAALAGGRLRLGVGHLRRAATRSFAWTSARVSFRAARATSVPSPKASRPMTRASG